MLTGKEIEKQLLAGRIIIDPPPKKINPNSVNLTLSPELLVYDMTSGERSWDLFHSPSGEGFLDMARDNPTQKLTIPPEGLILWPGLLYLGATNEYTETYCFVPVINGRSSVGRLGLSVHVTAGFGDCGFRGVWTLELSVIHPLKVYPNVEIAQIAYYPIEGNPGEYQGKYSGARGPQASRLFMDFLP